MENATALNPGPQPCGGGTNAENIKNIAAHTPQIRYVFFFPYFSGAGCVAATTWEAKISAVSMREIHVSHAYRSL
jgi:hypothetical protein